MAYRAYHAMNNAKTNEYHEWLTVANAARILGVSKQAVRQRIYRDTIPHRKASDGTVYVHITEHNSESNGETNGKSYAENIGSAEDVMRERIDELKDRIGFVERQLEREQAASAELRLIIAQLSRRVPELEAPPEQRESSVIASKESGKGTDRGDEEEPQQRSWWRRLLEG